MGNLRSVAKALEAAGASVVLTGDPIEADACDGLCVPGQGIFDVCMKALRSSGFDHLIRSWTNAERPFLGICLGMQALFEWSEEGTEPGLGILRGHAARIPGTVTVPHIGWNTVSGTAGETYYYFDHSFAVHPADESIVNGWTEHGVRFAAAVHAGPVTAVQFHPEKSGRDGIALLRQWLERA